MAKQENLLFPGMTDEEIQELEDEVSTEQRLQEDRERIAWLKTPEGKKSDEELRRKYPIG